MPESSPYVLACLSLGVLVSEWLVRRTFLRHIGTALLVILLLAIAANTGFVPKRSPVYDGVFAFAAPVGLFWLLLQVGLRDVVRAGGALIGLFLIGSMGTVLGVVAATYAVDAAASIGESYHAVAGMFVGTYTGGSVNFLSVAAAFEVPPQSPVYLGSMAVDNVQTALWMGVTLALPRILGRGRAPAAEYAVAGENPSQPGTDADVDRESLGPAEIGATLALGAGALWLSDLVSTLLERQGWTVPPILVLTTIALVLAQIPAIARMRGPRALGMFAVYLFLAVIGASCDLAALRQLGSLGLTLVLFTSIAIGVHGLIVFGVAKLAKVGPEVAAVASQANIGGGTSALALARSLGRNDLVLPAVLVGALGNAIGTYLGFLVARWFEG